MLEPDVQTATTDQILPLVCYGLGVAFVPEDFAREALAKKDVVQLELQTPPPVRYISLVKDKSRPLSVAAMELERRWCLSLVCGLSSAELLLRERDAKLRRSHGVCELHL